MSNMFWLIKKLTYSILENLGWQVKNVDIIFPLPVQERDSAPSPKYSTIEPVPPFTVSIPASLRITPVLITESRGITLHGEISKKVKVA